MQSMKLLSNDKITNNAVTYNKNTLTSDTINKKICPYINFTQYSRK